jgi:hypothetical protein
VIVHPLRIAVPHINYWGGMMSLRTLALLALALASTGCVTGRRTFDLPVTAQDSAASTIGSVYIASITDDRQFQNKPSDPSTPSIDGDVRTLSAQQKDQMIGRQRNGFGKAMGDIAFPPGDSVTKRVRLLVEQGLSRSGYRVTSDPNAPNSISVSVPRGREPSDSVLCQLKAGELRGA